MRKQLETHPGLQESSLSSNTRDVSYLLSCNQRPLSVLSSTVPSEFVERKCLCNVGGKSSFGRIEEQYGIERLKELKLKGF